MKYKLELEIAINASIKAGYEILNVYNSLQFDIVEKSDKSPLTLADKKAHIKIMEYLSKTKIPILSEEGRDIAYSERKDWNLLWIVDPLDGTKEFIKRNGEFTVNIALVKNGKTIIGVIYVPVKNTLYFGVENVGAYKIDSINNGNYLLDNILKNSKKMPIQTLRNNFIAFGSRSHNSKETTAFFKKLKQKHPKLNVIAMGSSLKFCLVAEGFADIYPRFSPTMEWDTAAGQAILEAAGKELIDYQTKKPMKYNRENLLNNWFIVE